jgi:hypothetical protein
MFKVGDSVRYTGVCSCGKCEQIKAEGGVITKLIGRSAYIDGEAVWSCYDLELIDEQDNKPLPLPG